ncbi:hypothetical protein M446_3765 [Methylobacterium sp. 4-46]|uniref:hypothetical protein n=1 Tax=unclassified Methylobacterium TaxID=2615210 RepID=UPI000165C916|nr:MULTISPECIES: hypothetical protein [Methylobacterium]ACA18144.1 hypothetical protein M446_3765 [Methylobacterium sp. 4-46]WFT77442.1 hypothetical protein QA634_19090 [Methylobacterium nodulans]
MSVFTATLATELAGEARDRELGDESLDEVSGGAPFPIRPTAPLPPVVATHDGKGWHFSGGLSWPSAPAPQVPARPVPGW